jgi:type II secretory pathway component PulM
MSALTRWYQGREEREQTFLLWGAIAVAVALIIYLALVLNRSVAASEQRLTQKRQDIAWLQSVAPQLAGRRPAAARGNESLVSLTERVAQESGIVKSMSGSQASGNGGLRVRMEKVSFDSLALWLGQMSEQYQVGIESATIDATEAAGLVNATVVLLGS